MGKYFLGSVGKAEAFRRDADGNLTLAFVSKTLTDSGINISTTKDDIRAGEGAPIQFSFYHDPNVEITLTDVLWKREYLEAQLGAIFNEGVDGQKDYVTDTLTSTDNTLHFEIEKIPLPCGDGDPYVVWGTEQGKEDWRVLAHSATKITTVDGLEANKKYCVRYFGADSRAKTAEITSTIIPEELFLIITAPLFSGDACAASRGKEAGHITFEVPRFQLNGAQEFAMNMSQNQTMSLAGTAVAGTSEDCETNAGKLLRIIEVLLNEDWYTDIVSLVVDEDSAVNGEKPVVYGVKKNGAVVLCQNKDLLYRSHTSDPYIAMTNAYTFSTGTVYLNINKGNLNPFLDEDDEVAVSAS